MACKRFPSLASTGAALSALLATLLMTASPAAELKGSPTKHGPYGRPQQCFPQEVFPQLYDYPEGQMVFRGVRVDPSHLRSRRALSRYLDFTTNDPPEEKRVGDVSARLLDDRSGMSLTILQLGLAGFEKSRSRLAISYSTNGAYAAVWPRMAGSAEWAATHIEKRNADWPVLVAGVKLDSRTTPSLQYRRLYRDIEGMRDFADLYFRPANRQVTWFLPVSFKPSESSVWPEYQARLYPVLNHQRLAREVQKWRAVTPAGDPQGPGWAHFADTLQKKGVLGAPQVTEKISSQVFPYIPF